MPTFTALPRSASSSTTLADLPPSSRATRLTVSAATADTRRPALVEPVKETIDRKSTRLNSSHSQISYAVFCLKKKSEQTHTALLPVRLPRPSLRGVARVSAGSGVEAEARFVVIAPF